LSSKIAASGFSGIHVGGRFDELDPRPCSGFRRPDFGLELVKADVPVIERPGPFRANRIGELLQRMAVTFSSVVVALTVTCAW